MVKNNTSYTLELGKYLCTISKVNFGLKHSRRYIVTATRFLGGKSVLGQLDNIQKTCHELDELVSFLRRIKYT